MGGELTAGKPFLNSRYIECRILPPARLLVRLRAGS